MFKKICFAALILFFSSTVFAQQITSAQLIGGTWTGTDAENRTGSFKFLDKKNVIVNFPGRGITRSTYVLYFKDNLTHIDITLKPDQEKNLLYAVMRRTDASTIKMQFADVWIAPETPKNTLLLKRMR